VYSPLAITEAQEQYNQVIGHFPTSCYFASGNSYGDSTATSSNAVMLQAWSFSGSSRCFSFIRLRMLQFGPLRYL
jgi:hypothetical protein